MPEHHSNSEDRHISVCKYRHRIQNLKTQQLVYGNVGSTFKIWGHKGWCT